MDHSSTTPDGVALASLLINCPDQVGIIAALANFFAERDLSILRYAEFTDDGHFFSRCEWVLSDHWEDEASFRVEFEAMANQYQARFDVLFHNRKRSIGLFVSKQPHALIEILNKQEANYFSNTEISFIIGDDKSIQALADRYGVPFFLITTEGDVLTYEARQLEIVHRYMNILSANFIARAACPIINIHHSFLPSFVGAKPYQMAYDRGVKLIGATSHFVTADLDHGPIIEQDVARVKPAASVDDMMKMGRDIEQKVFARAILKVLEHKAIVYKNRTIIFD